MDGTGQFSETVLRLSCLKSITGRNDPSDLGTNSNGELHSLDDGSMMPPSNIAWISFDKTALLECGILYALSLTGVA